MDDDEIEYDDEMDAALLPLHWTDAGILVCNLVGGVVGAVADAVNTFGRTLVLHQAWVYDRKRTENEMRESVERITREEGQA